MAPAAREVAARAVLHLDHPGAEVSQVAGADRGGDRLLDSHHENAGERPHIFSSRLGVTGWPE
jgi:hypothetical protein